MVDVATGDLVLLMRSSGRMLGIDVLRQGDKVQGCQVHAYGGDDKIHPDDLSEIERSLTHALSAIQMLRKS